MTDHNKKLVIAISSRALFNLDDSHHVFETEGLEAYSQYQIEHEEEVLEPGDAFTIVKKLLNIKKIQVSKMKLQSMRFLR